MTSYSFFCPCPRGLESLLSQEITEIARQAALPSGALSQEAVSTLKVHQTVPGGVHASGSLSDSYRLNLHSRLASRVLLRIAQKSYTNEADIYQLVNSQTWESWFDVHHTLRVDVVAIHSPLRSLEFITLKIKDAICDRFRSVCHQRPSIDTKEPDIRVSVFLDAKHAVVYLDTSGEALFKRGWRKEAGEAPLRENLAAGLLYMSGWQPGQVLFDPMCGSGTLLVEAAQRLIGMPAGWRRSFAFEKMRFFEQTIFQSIKDEVTIKKVSGSATLFGSDISGEMLSVAKRNFHQAGIVFDIPLKQIEAQHIAPPSAEPGIIVTNPPYGERIGVRGRESLGNTEASQAFFSELGSTLKTRFAGWEVYILSADLTLPQCLRLKESRKTPLFNGPLECRLFRFDMVAGSNRKKRDEKM